MFQQPWLSAWLKATTAGSLGAVDPAALRLSIKHLPWDLSHHSFLLIPVCGRHSPGPDLRSAGAI